MNSPVIIVTGASRGIGRAATIIALSQFNARVVAVARDEQKLKSLVQEVTTLGKDRALVTVVGDVTDLSTSKRAVKEAIDTWGQLDSIIFNAGALEPVHTLANVKMEDFKRLFDINVFSVVELCQLALPYLRQSKGSIVMLSSGASSKGYKAWGAYGASKAVINHLVSTLSVEEPDITSVAIRPGTVDTDMQGCLREMGKYTMGEDYHKFATLYEQGKLLNPGVPAYVIVALAVKASHELSGRYYSWDDEKLSEYQNV
ncbi:hypothetical protein BDF14DRAFT_1784966 [Spinellus fusiger]|nr:hypothetical protein BDF14DRAFT_1784966 [Spinellus fusiger]